MTHPAVSSHRSEDFGRDYGVLIKEWRVLQRSVFVIDGDGSPGPRRVRARPDAGARLRRRGGRGDVSGRLEALNAQLQTSWFMLWAGLEGLSDEEYLWEPAPGSPTVRVHPDGRWKRDQAGPGAVPTIAWRMCTLAATQTLRADWTFGSHRLQWHDIDLPG